MKIATLILLATSSAFAATSVYLSQKVQVDRSAASRIETERTRLSARVAQLEQEGAALRSEVQALRGHERVASRPATEPAPAAAQPGWNTGPSAGGNAAGFALFGNDQNGSMHSFRAARPAPPSPAMRKVMRYQMRQSLKRTYEGVGPELGLTTAQASQLIDLLADQSSRTFDEAWPADAAGQAPMRQTVQERQRQQEAELAALIGAEKLPRFTEFQKSLTARSELAQVQEQLAAADVPMSDEQRRTMLAGILDDQERYVRPAFQPGTSPEQARERMLAWDEDREQRLHANAEGVLNGEQMAVFSDYQQYLRDMRRQFQVMLPNVAPDPSAGVTVFAEGVAAPNVMLATPAQ